ncbi:MAG: hypothetical protein U0165_13125 [Polyangiaceae bacterium]
MIAGRLHQRHRDAYKPWRLPQGNASDAGWAGHCAGALGELAWTA